MQRAWKKNLLLLLVIGGLSSCAQTGLAPSPTATPTPLATAALQPTPQISADPGLFAAVTDRYEAEVVEGQNGYPLLKPILNSELPEGLGDDLEMVSVDSPEPNGVLPCRIGSEITQLQQLCCFR